ncbi:MAG TPA: RsmE family RNA methyltransferase [Candidatus Babeliales bacterium]|jgi:16S rRNA (uracil1498-N3)-methyltransferase|nr:RsmE family RNA methyltransferase [Candidatus Babeliales bacterium]
MKYKNQSTNIHEFALFIANLSAIINTRFSITQKDIVSRIISVIRLKPGDHIIFFDANLHTKVIIEHISKHSVEVLQLSQADNKELLPPIHVYLPLLKKDDLSDAVTMTTAAGVSTINLVYTQKTQGIWTKKDKERIERCIIAAAEQSKYFKLPTVYSPVSLQELIIHNPKSFYIFLDPEGIPLYTLIETVLANKPQSITIIIGPEGDLTTDEKAFLHKQGITFCALTPTILRSSLAAALSVAIFRSILIK